jgi:hypothetical protein
MTLNALRLRKLSTSLLAITILTFVTRESAALSSPVDYQIYCNSNAIYTATIISTSSLDCHLHTTSSCQPSGLVNLTVTPTSLLWGMPVPIGERRNIETTMLASQNDTTPTSTSGLLAIPTSNRTISNQSLSKFVNGKTFVIGQRNFTPETGRYFSYMWPIESETSILNATQHLCRR